MIQYCLVLIILCLRSLGLTYYVWLFPLNHRCPILPPLVFLGGSALFHGDPQAGGHIKFGPQLAAGAGRDRCGVQGACSLLTSGTRVPPSGKSGTAHGWVSGSQEGVPQTCALSHPIQD